MSTEDGEGFPEWNSTAGRSLGGCLRKNSHFNEIIRWLDICSDKNHLGVQETYGSHVISQGVSCSDFRKDVLILRRGPLYFIIHCLVHRSKDTSPKCWFKSYRITWCGPLLWSYDSMAQDIWKLKEEGPWTIEAVAAGMFSIHVYYWNENIRTGCNPHPTPPA